MRRYRVGVGLYSDRFLPRLVDLALGARTDELRAKVASGLSDTVLEVGFGSGRNLPHLPPAVTRLVAVDPAVHGRRLAAHRLAASPVPVEFVGLDGQDLPLADESVDHVLVTWTLCTIPDVGRALGEMHRVLRPGGALHFIEHGRSPNPKVARRQAKLSPWWGRVSGGCRLDRAIPDLIADAGFRTDAVQSYRLAYPELVGFTFEGVAVKG